MRRYDLVLKDNIKKINKRIIELQDGETSNSIWEHERKNAYEIGSLMIDKVELCNKLMGYNRALKDLKEGKISH